MRKPRALRWFLSASRHKWDWLLGDAADGLPGHRVASRNRDRHFVAGRKIWKDVSSDCRAPDRRVASRALPGFAGRFLGWNSSKIAPCRAAFPFFRLHPAALAFRWRAPEHRDCACAVREQFSSIHRRQCLVESTDLSSTGVGPDWGQTRSWASIGGHSKRQRSTAMAGLIRKSASRRTSSETSANWQWSATLSQPGTSIGRRRHTCRNCRGRRRSLTMEPARATPVINIHSSTAQATSSPSTASLHIGPPLSKADLPQ